MNRDDERARDAGYRQGAEDAAALADQYNGSTTHLFRLGDCILAKLNMLGAAPQVNDKRLESLGRAREKVQALRDAAASATKYAPVAGDSTRIATLNQVLAILDGKDPPR